MTRQILILAFACAVSCAQTKPFDLALSLNDATTTKAYKGWPLVLRADAVLHDDAQDALALESDKLSIVVLSASGEVVAWPLERNTSLAPTTQLSTDNDSVKIYWTLNAEQTSSLVPGTYTVRASWGGVDSEQLRFEIAAPPTDPGKSERIVLAQLRSEVALLKGDPKSALDVTSQALTEDPDTLSLLVQKALAHEALGELRQALSVAQTAMDRFSEQFPTASHPPITIISIHSRILNKLTEGAAQ